MGSEIAPRVLEGHVLPAGVAMAVARSGSLVRVTVTVMSGHPAAALTEGESGVIAFPSPVPVAAGERVAIVLRWASGSEECSGPVWMPVATVLREAHVRR
jgi:hypothetical protein